MIELFRGFGQAMVVGILCVYLLLVMLFREFLQPLTILSALPPSAGGALLFLFIFNYQMSIPSLIGMLMLMGIVTKNSILLVDFTNRLRAEGMPLDEAIERAGEIRFLPILLTSATAIGGMLPLAIQNAGMYSPLAWVIIGGLISSTLVARVVTPVMYKLIPPSIELDEPRAAATTIAAPQSS